MDESTTNLRSRAIGDHQRGGGLPFTRGGAAVEKQNRKIPRAEREQAARQRRAEQVVEQQLSTKVTRGEMLQLYKEQEHMVLALADRQEALFLTFKRIDRDQFDSVFLDSVQRIQRWRLKIRHLTNGGVPLSEFVSEIRKWNSDVDNPKIGARCFDFEWLTGQFSASDQHDIFEMTQFLQELGLTDEGITRVLGRNQTIATERTLVD